FCWPWAPYRRGCPAASRHLRPLHRKGSKRGGESCDRGSVARRRFAKPLGSGEEGRAMKKAFWIMVAVQVAAVQGGGGIWLGRSHSSAPISASTSVSTPEPTIAVVREQTGVVGRALPRAERDPAESSDESTTTPVRRPSASAPQVASPEFPPSSSIST